MIVLNIQQQNRVTSGPKLHKFSCCSIGSNVDRNLSLQRLRQDKQLNVSTPCRCLGHRCNVSIKWSFRGLNPLVQRHALKHAVFVFHQFSDCESSEVRSSCRCKFGDGMKETRVVMRNILNQIHAFRDSAVSMARFHLVQSFYCVCGPTPANTSQSTTVSTTCTKSQSRPCRRELL